MLKEIEYTDIFKGNIEVFEKDAQKLLQSKKDKLIWIDASSIWGYVSMEQLKK